MHKHAALTASRDADRKRARGVVTIRPDRESAFPKRSRQLVDAARDRKGDGSVVPAEGRSNTADDRLIAERSSA